MLPADGQQFENDITEEEIAFGAITDTFATLKDLGTTKLHSHHSVVSNLDNPVTLRYGTVSSLIVGSESFLLDGFVHKGLIEIKHNGVAPTSGSLKIRSW